MYNNEIIGYTGVANITVTGANNAPAGTTPVLPTSFSFVASSTTTANITLYNAAVTALVVTSNGLTVNGPASVTVVPAAVADYVLSNFPTSHITNEYFNVTVTPKDAFGNVTGSDGKKLTISAQLPSEAGSTPVGTVMDPLFGGSNLGPITGPATFSNLKYHYVGYVDLYVIDDGTPIAVRSVRGATADVYFDATTVVGSITVDLFNGVGYDALAKNVRAGDMISVRARLLDANNNPVKTGQTVEWSYTRTAGDSAHGAIGASPFSNTTTSDANGYLTVDFKPSTTVNDIFVVKANNVVTANSPNITVIPDDVIASFTFTTASLDVMAGVPFTVTVTAFDQFGNKMTDYANTRNLTFSGASSITSPNGTFNPIYPTNPVTFAGGETSGIQITMFKDETVDLTVALTSDANVKGTLANVNVGPNVVKYYTVGAPSTGIAHAPFNVLVTPFDFYGNITVGPVDVILDARLPNGTVGAPAGILTGATTVDTTAGPATASVIYNRVDVIDVHARDAAGNISNDSVTQDTAFSPNVPAEIVIGALAATYTAGQSVNVTATVRDAAGVAGNLVADGTLITWTFTSTATSAGFGNPTASSIVTSTLNGVTSAVFHPDTVAYLNYTITASWNAVNGTSTPFTILPAVTDHYTVTVPAVDQMAGVSFTITVTAYDVFGNVNDLHNATEPVVYSGPAPAYVLGTMPVYPATTTFAAGIANVPVTLYRAESVAITATRGSVTGTSSHVTIVPNALAFYHVLYHPVPPIVEEYSPFGVTIVAVDNWYNERPGASSVNVFAEPVAPMTLMGTLTSASTPSLIINLDSGRAVISDLVYSEAQNIYIVAKDLNNIRSTNGITGLISIVDTVPPTSTGATTFGDGLGNVNKAIIVFDEIIVQQVGFNPAAFTINGIGATAFSFTDAFTLNLTFAVPGTEIKTIVYTNLGGLTDTAGNALASYIMVAVDKAEPVLMSYTQANTDGNNYLNTVTFNYSEPMGAASASLMGWQIYDRDGVTNLLAGLVPSNVAVVGSSLVFTLGNNSGTTGAPFYMYENGNVQDLSGNKAANVNNNPAPVVNAGADQLDLLPSLVFLSATASDANQPTDTLKILWTLVGGPGTANIVNANMLNAEVLLMDDGAYVFACTATDVFGIATTDTVTIGIVNVAPVANAGPTVFINRTLTPTTTLDGSETYDPNNDTITYLWTGAASLNLTNVNGAIAGIAPTVDGVYTVTLTVTDDDGAVGISTVTVIVSSEDESVPFGHAGYTQHTIVGKTVQLDGRGSADADSDTITFAWTQVSGTPVAIANANTALATFTPVIPGWYEFNLEVHDGTLPGIPSRVKVLAVSDGNNNAPVANAGLDKTIQYGKNVMLDATDSSDVDGDTLTFQWRVVRGYAVLDSLTTARPIFTPVVPGTYIFELIVSDGVNMSLPDRVTINVVKGANVPPVAIAGYSDPSAVGIYLPTTVHLTNGSYDMNNDALKYHWIQTSGPIVEFNQRTATPSFTPVLPGVYSFLLIVSDGTNVSFAEVVVPVNSGTRRIPKAVTMPERAFHVNTLAFLKGSGGWARDGYTWVQVSGPTLIRFESNYLPVMRFTPVALGSYTFALYTYNGYHRSLPAYVTIHVVTADTPLPGGGGGGGGCFVATAAFGTMSADSVKSLTGIRDSALALSRTSDSLVGLYYVASPSIAETMTESDALRAIFRSLLDR